MRLSGRFRFADPPGELSQLGSPIYPLALISKRGYPVYGEAHFWISRPNIQIRNGLSGRGQFPQCSKLQLSNRMPTFLLTTEISHCYSEEDGCRCGCVMTLQATSPYQPE